MTAGGGGGGGGGGALPCGAVSGRRSALRRRRPRRAPDCRSDGAMTRNGTGPADDANDVWRGEPLPTVRVYSASHPDDRVVSTGGGNLGERTRPGRGGFGRTGDGSRWAAEAAPWDSRTAPFAGRDK